MSSSRQLAAIMFTDIVGYTALMQKDEQKTVTVIKHYNSSLQKWVAQFNGQVLNYYGDGSLCIFSSSIEAVNCSLEIQKDLLSDPVVPLRIGLHIGEIFFEDGKALGDAVNVASRIQSLGQANTILLSHEIFDKIRNHPEFKTVSLGHFDFKNVQDPIEVFALANEGLLVPQRNKMEGKLKHNLPGKKKTARRILMIAISLFILVVAGIFIYKIYFSPQNNNVEKSIAIIPFRNMSNDPQQEYFAEGMMDEILNHLFKIGGLNVISRTSSMVYKDTKKTSKEIANELGVGNLLEGSVQKDGDHIRIIVQLINGKTDDHLWAETYNREFKDVFSIQSDIAQQIAAALKVKIDAITKSRIEYIPTQNTSAYNLYLQARKRELRTGWKELLEEVIQLDSSFAPAYADLGFSWLLRGGYWGDLGAKEVLDSARPYLQKALILDSNLASVHNYIAQMNLWYQWDFKLARKEWDKFFQLNPSGTVWADNYHDFLQASGRFKEALDFAAKNYERDKKHPGWLTDIAKDYYFLGQPEKSQSIIDSLRSHGNTNYYSQAWLFVWLGRYQQGLDNLRKHFEQDPGSEKNPRTQAWLAICYFHTGKPGETTKIIDKLQLRSKSSSVGSPSFHQALIYSATGRKELALQLLEKAYADHELEMYWLKVEPLFSPLHNEPKFQSLLKKIGFD